MHVPQVMEEEGVQLTGDIFSCLFPNNFTSFLLKRNKANIIRHPVTRKCNGGVHICLSKPVITQACQQEHVRIVKVSVLSCPQNLLLLKVEERQFLPLTASLKWILKLVPQPCSWYSTTLPFPYHHWRAQPNFSFLSIFFPFLFSCHFKDGVAHLGKAEVILLTLMIQFKDPVMAVVLVAMRKQWRWEDFVRTIVR